MIDQKDIILKIKNADSVCIYGAGMMANCLYKCISEAPYHKQIETFIVRSLKNNPQLIDGIPVVDLQNSNEFHNKLLLVALHEKYLPEALNDLKEAGFKDIVSVSFDNDLWTEIRKEWMLSNKLTDGINISMLDEPSDKQMHLFVVHSAMDKKIAEVIENSIYERSIQVGAALTDQVLFELRDDVGDNISSKNKQYCELTALYWIWKNDSADYLGISHYRRRFVLSDYDVHKIFDKNIDIVVTVPIVNFATVRKQYEKDHDIHDWDIMLEAIKTLYPDYYEAADRVQNGNCYYAYNMFIAKKKIFNNYCEWLFNILEYCVSRIGEKEDVYQNRYAGFLAERLLTIFLVYNQHFKIAVANKHFIESNY